MFGSGSGIMSISRFGVFLGLVYVWMDGWMLYNVCIYGKVDDDILWSLRVQNVIIFRPNTEMLLYFISLYPDDKKALNENGLV